jgi:hypothetical protein
MDKMKAEPKNVLVIEEVQESFETWANQAFISAETRELVLKSNLLLIPILGFRELPIPVFPVCTEELFQFIKETSPKEIVPEICIEEKDYKELALHSALLIVGGFLVTALVAPVAVDLIAEYIKRRFLKQSENNVKAAKEIILQEEAEKDEVKVELTVVEESGKALKFSYEGPADDFRKNINAALKASADKMPVGENPRKHLE